MKKIFVLKAAIVAMAPTITTASVIDIDVTLRLDSMMTSNVEVWDDTSSQIKKVDTLNLASDPWGIAHPFSKLNTGDTLSFKTTINPQTKSGLGQASDCMIGSFNCNTSEFLGSATASGSSFWLADTETATFSISGATIQGGTVRFSWCNDNKCLYSGANGLNVLHSDIEYSFTVLGAAPVANRTAANSPAVVPLPASLPLFAIGLLGFAYFRRRTH